MSKICFIIPYFGTFPNYFQLFLNSCRNNHQYNWLIITDNQVNYSYPSNVKKVVMLFEELRELFQKKFDFEIALDRPYKLCDYKPAYGYLLSEYIKEFEFWGHCDIDLIFGDLNKFFKEELFLKYDKIHDLGHLTLYKNTEENNMRFMQPYCSKQLYKEVYTTTESCIFDELYHNSINNIFEEYQIPVLCTNISADIYTKSSNFRITHYDKEQNKDIVEKHKKNIFCYKEGKILNYRIQNNTLLIREYAYIHLQKRKMEVKISQDATIYSIIPNSFIELNNEITLSNFGKIKKKDFNLHYFKIRSKNLWIKTKKILKFKHPLQGGI